MESANDRVRFIISRWAVSLYRRTPGKLLDRILPLLPHLLVNPLGSSVSRFGPLGGIIEK
jgi:hypothetical protein